MGSDRVRKGMGWEVRSRIVGGELETKQLIVRKIHVRIRGQNDVVQYP